MVHSCVACTFRLLKVKKYDSKAAVAGTPKTYSTGEDMVDVKVSHRETQRNILRI